MTASALANSAYGPKRGGVQSPKETEYQVFARVTGAMSRAQEAGDFVALVHAVYDNSRLWTVLAADVALPENPLPPALRGQIIDLAQFSLLHANKVLASEATADALIDINQTIMKGLRPGAAVAA